MSLIGRCRHILRRIEMEHRRISVPSCAQQHHSQQPEATQSPLRNKWINTKQQLRNRPSCRRIYRPSVHFSTPSPCFKRLFGSHQGGICPRANPGVDILEVRGWALPSYSGGGLAGTERLGSETSWEVPPPAGEF